jgi:hypothetical protein
MTTTVRRGRKALTRRRRVLVTLLATSAIAVIGAAFIVIVAIPSSPDLDCNGTTMRPGSVCVTTLVVNGHTTVEKESYNDRIAAAHRHKTGPIVVAASVTLLVGTLVAARVWRWSRTATAPPDVP